MKKFISFMISFCLLSQYGHIHYLSIKANQDENIKKVQMLGQSSFEGKSTLLTHPIIQSEIKRALDVQADGHSKSIQVVEQEVVRQANLELPAYVVQADDQLEQLAKVAQHSIDQIAKENHLDKNKPLQTGDLLIGILDRYYPQKANRIDTNHQTESVSPNEQGPIYNNDGGQAENRQTSSEPTSSSEIKDKETTDLSQHETTQFLEDIISTVRTTSIEETPTTNQETTLEVFTTTQEESIETTTTTIIDSQQENDLQPVYFESDILRKEIARALTDSSNLFPGEPPLENIDWKSYQPTFQDMKKLKKFHSSMLFYGTSDEHPRSLLGLEAAIHLQELHLGYADAQSYDEIGQLKELTHLSLPGNDLTDLNFLQGTTHLQSLNVGNNQLTDLSGIEGNLHLKTLSIGENQIQNILAIQAMTQLEVLYAIDNQISDITPLEGLQHLTQLNLARNALTSIEGLGEKPLLTQLELSENILNDISALSTLSSLESLNIISTKNISDLQPLSKLTSLKFLSIRDNQVTDVTPLKDLTNLIYLHLYENQIQDISAIQNLTQLRELNISKNQIQDLTPIQEMQKLRVLFAYQNHVSDPSPILGLENLRVVNLAENRVYDLSPLIQHADPLHREGYVLDRGENHLRLNQFQTSKDELGRTTYQILNPIKNILGKFVKIDSQTNYQPSEYDWDYYNKAVLKYNEQLAELNQSGIRVESISIEEDNDHLLFVLPDNQVGPIRNPIKVTVPFIEIDGINYDYYETDFPTISLDSYDYPIRAGEKYELTNPFSGSVEFEFQPLESTSPTDKLTTQTETTTEQLDEPGVASIDEVPSKNSQSSPEETQN